MVANWLATAEVTGIQETEAGEKNEKTNFTGRRRDAETRFVEQGGGGRTTDFRLNAERTSAIA